MSVEMIRAGGISGGVRERREEVNRVRKEENSEWMRAEAA
jgi:hypothetical protein